MPGADGEALVFTGAQVFDGKRLFARRSLRVVGGRVAAGPGPGRRIPLGGGMLVPGFLDLQVNGGGGRMVGPALSVADLADLCATHARLGATGILPTLITDRPEATRQVLDTAREAARRQVPGFLGLHLEGPHLDPRRAGAHDPALIRPMTEEDLAALCQAAADLPALMVTLAPEAATPDQIARLTAAGGIVSLGHSACSAAEAQAAMAAGARAITHLFNAMSQLGSREPGLVGAALTGPVHAGLIADLHHVAAASLRIALAASDRLFLVSDAMAVAGTGLDRFALQGRTVLRQGGRLVLADGTLAGADLSLPQAVANLIGLGCPAEMALAMATTRPAEVLGRADLGHLCPGAPADMLHFGPDGTLRGVWRAGQRLL
jgi:N-acetylglucosamine-6-phosphate deacetylase